MGMPLVAGGGIGTIVIALLVIIVARILASLGIIACGIGILFTMFWATVTMGSASKPNAAWMAETWPTTIG